MNDINQLKQLLEFYDKNLRGAATRHDPFEGGAFSVAPRDSGENRPGLLWAQEFMRSQMRPEHPDFFAGQPGQQAPAYVPPQAVDMNAPRPQTQMRTDYFANDALRPGVNNYLARLLGMNQNRYSGAS